MQANGYSYYISIETDSNSMFLMVTHRSSTQWRYTPAYMEEMGGFFRLIYREQIAFILSRVIFIFVELTIFRLRLKNIYGCVCSNFPKKNVFSK